MNLSPVLVFVDSFCRSRYIETLPYPSPASPLTDSKPRIPLPIFATSINKSARRFDMSRMIFALIYNSDNRFHDGENTWRQIQKSFQRKMTWKILWIYIWVGCYSQGKRSEMFTSKWNEGFLKRIFAWGVIQRMVHKRERGSKMSKKLSTWFMNAPVFLRIFSKKFHKNLQMRASLYHVVSEGGDVAI